jgi:O-antigen/teichoic acid export membrane protein
MSRRPSVLSSTLSTFTVGVASSVLSLANVLIVARVLGPSGRGQIVFLMTMAMLTSRFAALGVQEANVNFGSTEPELRGRLATNSLVLALVAGGMGAAIVLALAAVFPAFGGHSDTALRWLALGSVPMLVFNGSLLRLVHADYRFGLANLSTFITPAVNLALSAAFALADALTVGTALLSWLAGWAVGTVLLAVYTQLRLAAFDSPDAGLARRMLGFGLKSHLGRLMSVGNYRLDQWFLGALSSSREPGLYSIAVAWFETLTFLPTALATVLRPHVARATPREAAARTAAAFRITALVTVVFVIAMILLAPFLCVTFFGEEFRGSIGQLRVLAFGAFGLMALRIIGSSLAGQGKPLLETAAIAVGLAATIVLDVALIPPFGAMGAAAASVAAYSAIGLAIVFLFTRALDTRWSDLRPRRADLQLLWSRLRP